MPLLDFCSALIGVAIATISVANGEWVRVGSFGIFAMWSSIRVFTHLWPSDAMRKEGLLRWTGGAQLFTFIAFIVGVSALHLSDRTLRATVGILFGLALIGIAILVRKRLPPQGG
jgi:hypothetical protein